MGRKLHDTRLEALGLEEVTIADGAHRFADNLLHVSVVIWSSIAVLRLIELALASQDRDDNSVGNDDSVGNSVDMFVPTNAPLA